MQIAPNARVDDGAFDWVIVPAMSRPSLLRKIPLLYSGAHLRDPRILHGRGQTVEARAMNVSICESFPVEHNVGSESIAEFEPLRFADQPVGR